MSGYPNNFYGQTNPPRSVSPMPNQGVPFNLPTTSSNQAFNMSNPNLRQLAEFQLAQEAFRRQNATVPTNMLPQSQQQQQADSRSVLQPQQQQRPTAPVRSGLPNLSDFTPDQLRAIQSRLQGVQDPAAALQQFLQNTQGRRQSVPIQGHQAQMHFQQASRPSSTMALQQQPRPVQGNPQMMRQDPAQLQQGSSPMLGGQAQVQYHPSVLSTPPQGTKTPTRPPSPPRPAVGRRPSIPVTQAFTLQSASVPSTSAATSRPNTVQPVAPERGVIEPTTTKTSELNESTPKMYKPRDPVDKPRLPRKKPTPSAPPPVYFRAFEVLSRQDPLAIGQRQADKIDDGTREFGEGRKRALEGFRGSMRNELAKLSYAAGDVEYPSGDTIEYLEDLVIEFMADLCRPVPPVRTNKDSAHAAVRLTPSILRHRLTRPAMRKYLDRFDLMSHLTIEIAQNKKAIQGNESYADIVKDVSADWLGIDEAEEEVPKKRGRPAKARGDGATPAAERGVAGVKREREDDQGDAKQRKKPGPRKGWKDELTPEERLMRKKGGPRRRKEGSMGRKSREPSGSGSPMAS